MKNSFRRILTLVLALSMTVCLLSAAALADDNTAVPAVSETAAGEAQTAAETPKTSEAPAVATAMIAVADEGGNAVAANADGSYTINAAGNYTVSSACTTPIVVNADGVTLNLDNVTITADKGSAIELTSGVTNIVVTGDCSLTGAQGGAGVAVPAGATLNLSGTGSLTAVGNGGTEEYGKNYKLGGAGIGGTDSCGTINITGLSSLEAYGYGKHASGIGGTDGTVSIEGVNNIKAWGGQTLLKDTETSSDSKGTLQVVTLDGTVYSYSLKSSYGKTDPEGGAAIGGGSVTIEKSTVSEAVGGSKAAAIGTGFWSGTSVTISNSTLNNIIGGGTSAAIGNARNQKDAVDITITNSNVQAIGGIYGAAIGSGYNENSMGNKNETEMPETNITISGGVINAAGGMGGAAIGGGYKGNNVGITIENAATVTAVAGVNLGDAKYENPAFGGASGIGCGADGSGKFTAGTISIEDGCDVTAASTGGKWAIDLNCTVDGVVNAYQAMFLLDGSKYMTNKTGADDFPTSVIDETKENTVKLGTKTVALPAGYICAAATQSTKGSYTTLSGSKLFSQCDNYNGTVDYKNADKDGLSSVKSTDFAVKDALADSSYTYVALRGDEATTYSVAANYYTSTNGGTPVLTGTVTLKTAQPAAVGATVTAAASDGSDNYNNQSYTLDSAKSAMTLTTVSDPAQNVLTLNYYRSVITGIDDTKPSAEPSQPAADIADPEIPAADKPDADITDPETPATDIPEPNTPKADASAQVTGDSGLIVWSAVTAAFSIAGLAYLSVSAKKRGE